MKFFIALVSIFAALLSMTTRAAVILQYHHIDTATPSLTSTSPELFAQHLEYLHDNDFSVLALDDLLARVFAGEQLPSKTVAITFDDGYASVASQAAPLLEQYSFPYTVFVNPNLIGNSSDFLSWEQIEGLREKGALIANHTLDHPHLVRRNAEETLEQWQNRIRDQIAGAENALESQLGYSPALLAYPYGEYDRHVEALVAELGIVAFGQQSGAFDARVDRQAIPRFAFGGGYGGMEDFISKVNTLALPWVEITTFGENGEELNDPLLPPGVTRPQLRIELESPQLARQINCYASGQGALEIVRGETSISTRPNSDLPVGRSRINCTAPSAEPGRFYWYSEFFMRKNPDGSWYSEY